MWRSASVAVLVLTLAVAACAGPAPTLSPSPGASAPPGATVPSVATSVAPSFASGRPAGLIAMGHSGLTGEGTGGTYEAVFENSWATGTNPAVNSVYLRLKAAHPEIAGQPVNTAHGGAVANELAGMTLRALETTPTPALAIISTIDNDIHCDGADPQRVPQLGASVLAALDAIRTASPETRMLVVGQLGRPSIPFVQAEIADDPRQAAPLTGTEMCDFLNPDGTPNAAHFANLTKIIDAFEAEEARVCATVPYCMTDGGVRKAYKDTIENFSPDFAHLNVKGQAAEAELIWPVVAKLLGL